MTIIGLTGGSGVGKTTVMEIWSSMGADCIDADAVYHHLLQTDEPLLLALREAFPEAFLSGSLDRKAMGRAAFADKTRLAHLESITHGAITHAIEARLTQAAALGRDVAVVEAVGLLRSPLRSLCTVVVGVVAPTKARLARIIRRDGLTEDYARARILSGPQDDWLRPRCDCILENNAGPSELHQKAAALYELLGSRE